MSAVYNQDDYMVQTFPLSSITCGFNFNFLCSFLKSRSTVRAAPGIASGNSWSRHSVSMTKSYLFDSKSFWETEQLIGLSNFILQCPCKINFVCYRAHVGIPSDVNTLTMPMEIALLGMFPSILVFLCLVSKAHPFQQLHVCVLRSCRAGAWGQTWSRLVHALSWQHLAHISCSLLIESCFLCI